MLPAEPTVTSDYFSHTATLLIPQPVLAMLVLPSFTEKPYICSYQQVYLIFLQFLKKSTLTAPTRLVLQVKIADEDTS